MKLGPSLIGAVIGGLVGVAAQIGLESAMGKETIWFALVIGLLSGFGARVMAGDAMKKASFVRAGLVALISLAAIFGGSYTSSELTLKKHLDAYDEAPSVTPSETPSDRPDDEPATEEAGESDEATTDDSAAETDEAEGDQASADAAETETDDAAADSTDEEQAVEPTEVPKQLDLTRYELKETPRQKLDILQLLFVVLGTLISYELARGGK